MRILLLLLVGGSIGAVSGALGIGGGILLVPALIWIFGFDYGRAAGTSLAVLVPPIGLLAAVRAYQEDRVDLQAAMCIALAFAVGAYGGAASVRYLPVEALRFAFGLLMIFIAVRFVVSASSEATAALTGIIAVSGTWIAYLVLRLIGRRSLARPRLDPAIHEAHRLGPPGTDYQI